MSIDALILDFGGVISKTLFETHDQTARALGIEPASLGWLGPFDVDTDPLWQSMQNNAISERDYWLTRSKELGQLVGEQWDSMAQMIQRVRGADPQSCLRPEAIDTIRQVRDHGKKLAILSNELDMFYGADFRHKASVMECFDVICDATYTGILKPDPRAYEDCFKQLNVAPEHCLFVDDQLRNIRGAEAVGYQVVHFDVRNPQASYEHILNLTLNA